MKLRLKLKTKIAIAVSLVFAGVISCAAWAAISYFASHYKKTIAAQQFTLISVVADEMDARMRAAQEMVIEKAATVAEDTLTSRSKAQSFLDSQSELHRLFNNGIFLFDPQGRMLAESPLQTGRVGSDFSFREYFKVTVATGKPYISMPYRSSQPHGHPAVMFTAPLTDRQGKLAGVFACSLDLYKDGFISRVTRTKIGGTGYLYIYSSDRTMVMHPDPSRILKQDVPPGVNRLFDKAIAGYEGTEENMNSRGLHSLASFKHLKSVDWIIGANFPIAEAYAPVYRLKQFMVAGLLLTLAVTLGLVWFLVGYLGAPLRLFARHVETLAGKSGRERFLVLQTNDEIGDLADSFNRMVEELDSQRGELEKKEELYRTLTDFSSDFVFWSSPDWSSLEYVSPRCLEFTGYEDAAFYENPALMTDIIHPDDRSAWTDLKMARSVSDEDCSVVVRMVSRSGLVKWVRLSSRPVVDTSGRFLGVRGSFVDITAIKEAEEESRYRARFLQTIIDAIPSPIFYKDADGVYLGCNRAFQEYLGLSREQIVGKSVFGLAPENLANIYFAADAELFARRGTQVYEASVKYADGSIRQVIYYKATFDSVDGTLGGLVGTMLDITERKAAEDTLRKLSHVVDQSPVSVLITDVNGLIEYVNPKFEEVTGFSADEAIGRNPRFMKSEQTPPEVYRTLWETVLAGGVWQGEFRNCKKNGEIYWEVAIISPLRDAAGNVTHFVGVKEDVTERKRLEAELGHTQKMEAVGRLAGGIAHDFNNILTAIIGYASMLEMQLEQGSQQSQDVKQIILAAERAATLTQGLLAYSRKQITNPSPVKINEIVVRVEQLLQRFIGEDVELKTFFAEGEPVVMADSTQVEQVLMNLAANARDAMPSGGKLTIATALFEMDHRFVVSHGFGSPGNYLCLTIADTGLGMDQSIVKRIFEPFFTTKEVGKGTGLGLSIVYGIVKKHEGHITCYSEKGKGTVFNIYLPLISSPVDAVQAPQLSEKLTGKEMILLAEDDPSVRAFARYLLEDLGYVVVEAVDGVDALARFAEYGTRIQLLILDVIMPKKNGKEVYDEIRSVVPEMKAIFCSGYTADIISARGIFAGEIHFLSKPFSPGKLTAKVREVLDS